MKPKAIIKLSDKEPVKLEPIENFMAVSKEEIKKLGLAFPKDFKAAVVVDKGGSPKYFVFDTYSLWDILCAFDERFEKYVSTREYVFQNPVGLIIDSIESHLPLNPKLVLRLKRGVEEAKKLGLVPFEKIKHELGL